MTLRLTVAPRRRAVLRLEALEDRTTPAALTPAQVRHAYGFDQITFNGIVGDGTGQTIAVIDAFNDPFLLSDLDTFDQRYGASAGGPTLYQQYGAASSFLTVATPQGAPRSNAGWAGEIALDVEWAHAIAPGAKILLVEARNDSSANLNAAVNYARSQPGVSVVSMSWAGDEFPGESSSDSLFTTPAGHTGVSFVAASGDNGAPATYPATSPNVLSVGGTMLRVDGAGNYLGETGWTDSTGGVSQFEAKPVYQQGVVTQSATRRANPDVSYDADPDTGFVVYNTYDGGWEQVGGTSAGTPQWAALIAIADQGRALAGLPTLDGPSQLLPAIYALPAQAFHDVTSGTSSGSTTLSAGPGYDLVTGRGSPVAPLVVAGIAGVGVTGNAATTGSMSGTALVGADAGGPPVVRLINLATGAIEMQFNAFDPGFRGGVRVARADVNGDGVPDIIAAAGPGGGPQVSVFSGATGALLREFMAYDPGFRGGVYVAAADVNGDGFADIIVGAGPGGGPHVEVFSGRDGSLLQSFFAYSPGFRGGVTVAAGDVNGDGLADVITGAGPGGGPHVEAFSGRTGSLLESFMAYDPGFTGGVFVAAGDVNGDGAADIITGTGAGGAPTVNVFSGKGGAPLESFAAFDPTFTGGVRVAAADVNGDGLADVVAVPGSGAPTGRAFDGLTAAALGTFAVLDPSFLGGVFVG